MAACEFSINYNGSEEELISKARNGILGAGGKFEGDTKAGSFEIPVPGKDIEGSYVIATPDINIIINKKSILVSCERIQEELEKYLGNGGVTDVSNV